MKWEAQRAVNEKKVVNMEGYKQVQSDTRHLLNIRGITSNVTRHMAQVLRKFSNLLWVTKGIFKGEKPVIKSAKRAPKKPIFLCVRSGLARFRVQTHRLSRNANFDMIELTLPFCLRPPESFTGVVSTSLLQQKVNEHKGK
jgi:hypothetical protein